MLKYFFLFFCFFMSERLGGQGVSKIKVVSVPLYTTSPHRISCGRFDKSFDTKHELLLKAPAAIKKIEILLLKFKPEKISGIDVRGKLIVCYRNKKCKTICFDEFGYFFVDGIIAGNKDLFSYLLKERLVEY